jgi:hypothetical protein
MFFQTPPGAPQAYIAIPLPLPHRQFVWTIPKVLLVFLRWDRELFAEIGRLLFDILFCIFTQASARARTVLLP